MKKKFICFMLLAFSCSMFAQSSKPIMGYGKVKFGTSLETVCKEYGLNIGDAEIKSNEGFTLSEIFQKDVSDQIEGRSFIFFNDKLLLVDVSYKNTIDDNILLKRLESIYGKYTFQESTDGEKRTESFIFDKYLPDLKVELSFVHFTLWGIPLMSTIVRYESEILADELKKQQENTAMKNLEL